MSNWKGIQMRNTSVTKIIIICFSCWLLLSSAMANDSALTLGIFPYVSPSKLVRHNTKFKQYLEQKTARKISIVTAPDFREFVRRTKNGEYDLIFTAPHHGHYAELHNGYQRIAMTRHHIQGYFLVRKNSSYQGVENLRGKVLTTTSPVTILTQMALEQLHQHGLTDADLTILNTSTHSNAIYSVINNDSDAALTGVKLWQRLNSEDKDKLRVLDTTEKAPGFMFMGKKSLAPETIRQLQTLAIQFNSEPAGQDYLFKGFQLIDDDSMNNMDKFIMVFDSI